MKDISRIRLSQDLTLSRSLVLIISTAAVVLLVSRSFGYLHGSDRKNTQPKPDFKTLRVSNIPASISKEDFRNILASLPSEIGNNVLLWSFTPAAIKAFSRLFCVATVTFHVSPHGHELEKALKQIIGQDAARLKVDSDFFGITPLADPGEDTKVDIIAVTGLAGHGFGSWKAKGKPDMWLRDFLPATIPDARILAYGYDTSLSDNLSNASVLQLSTSFREAIKSVRGEQAKQRPLLLIGHSLGGLVIKQTLVQASQGSPVDKEVFMSCSAVLFFGVPNRGLENQSLKAMVKEQPTEGLVNHLGRKSQFAPKLHTEFFDCFNLDGSKIVSWYEMKDTPTVEWDKVSASWRRTGPPVMMVDQNSATYAGKNEEVYDQLPINANHSDMVKFSDISDQDYVEVQARIESLANDAPGLVKNRFVNHRRKLSQTEIEYIKTLKAPDIMGFRNSRVPNPLQGTLQWLPHNDKVKAWLTEGLSSFLWIRGAPGQGKTVLTKFLLKYLEEEHARLPDTAVIYFLFSSQDETFRTVRNALRSLIKQLLTAGDLFKYFHESDLFFESPEESEDTLWEILEYLLRAPTIRTIYCVLDALDESGDADSRQRLLQRLKRHVKDMTPKKKGMPSIKLLVTSRPTVEINRIYNHFPFIHLKANNQDLEVFIKGSISDLNLKINLQEIAIRLLLQQAEQTFLWVSIMLKKLRTCTLLSQADIEDLIRKTPSDLKELYDNIVDDIMHGSDERKKKLLVWVVYARHPLKMGELDDAIATQLQSPSRMSIENHRAQLSEGDIIEALGVIAEIREGQVHLIHLSAKEALRENLNLKHASVCSPFRPSIYLARICMTYLCFEDFQQGPCREKGALQQRKETFPFLEYAANNWHTSISDDDVQEIFDLMQNITKPLSAILLSWTEAAGLPGCETATEAWDIAMCTNISFIAEPQMRSSVIDKDKVIEAFHRGFSGYDLMKKLVSSNGVQFTGDAIHALVRHFDHVILQTFLDQAGTIIVTNELLKEAMKNRRSGLYIMRLLLGFLTELTITEDLVQAADQDKDSCQEIFQLLLSAKNAIIDNDAASFILQYGSWRVIALMLSLHNDKATSQVTPELLTAAAGNEKHGLDTISTLLKSATVVTITLDLVKAVLDNEESGQIMRLLLNKEVTFIGNDAAAEILQNGNEEVLVLMLSLHKEGKIPLTSEQLVGAAGNKKRVLNAIRAFSELSAAMNITADVVHAALNGERVDDPEQMLEFLLCLEGSHIENDAVALILDKGPESIIDLLFCKHNASAIRILYEQSQGNQNPLSQTVKRFIELQWERFGPYGSIFNRPYMHEHPFTMVQLEFIKNLLGMNQEFRIDEDLIKQVAEHLGEPAMNFLLSRLDPDVFLTEAVFEAACQNYLYGGDILNLLTEQKMQIIPATEERLEAAAGHERHSYEIMRFLLEQDQDQYFPISEKIVLAAASHPRGTEVISYLLEKKGENVPITQAVLERAARSSDLAMVKLILKERGQHLSINEAVLEAAAGNSEWGASILEEKLEEWSQKVPITESIVLAAAGGWRPNLRLKMLMQAYGDIPITAAVIEKTVANRYLGSDAIQLLARKNRQAVIDAATGCECYEEVADIIEGGEKGLTDEE